MSLEEDISFVLIKPDGYSHRYEIEEDIKCLRLGVSAKKDNYRISEPLAEIHYNENKNEWYFPRSVKQLMSGPTEALIINGDDALDKAREFLRSTDNLISKILYVGDRTVLKEYMNMKPF